MTEVADKCAVVTGAASGIGRLLAIKLAERGARLALWDVDRTGLAEVCASLAAGGHQVRGYECDLASREQIKVAAERTLTEAGPVDILVNNAGIVSGRSLLEIPDELIEQTFRVNVLAHFWTVRAFLPGMLERESGHIVTVASAAALASTAKLADYCSSKAAVFGFDEALRLELRQHDAGIKTTVVCPFYTATGMFTGVRSRFPWLLPILDPELVAERIAEAIRRDRSRLIMPWFVYAAWPARLLPVGAFDALMDLFGISRSMDEFVAAAEQRENVSDT